MLRILLRNFERLQALVLKVIQENADHPTSHVAGTTIDLGLFQLKLLVQGILDNVQSLIEKGSITVRNQIPDDLYIYADDFLMAQVFQNLLSNAMKYTPEGEIVVGAESSAE